MFHFVNDYHDGDEEAAKASIESYKIGGRAFKESILTTWININGMPLRMAKELFNIGAHKYTRLKDQRPKLKPELCKLKYSHIIVIHNESYKLL